MKKIYWIVVLSLHCLIGYGQSHHIPEIGVVQNIENDSVLKSFGYRYLIENTSKLLSPRTITDAQFSDKLGLIKQSRIPIYACNIFIPGELKVVGPAVNEAAVLDYVEIVFRRARQAGLTMIIWGSGGSRRIPDGFDRVKAKEQFIAIAKKVARLASKYDITLALENLNTTEVNFINTLREALEIVTAVDHKNLRLCADVYHMLKENEPADMIVRAKGYIVYCEIAQKEKRSPPAKGGDDFRPYFLALKKIDFNGKIVIECQWEDIQAQGQAAYQEVHDQVEDVFGR